MSLSEGFCSDCADKSLLFETLHCWNMGVLSINHTATGIAHVGEQLCQYFIQGAPSKLLVALPHFVLVQLDTDIAADRKMCSSWHSPSGFWLPHRAAAQAVSLSGAQIGPGLQHHEGAQARGKGVDGTWDDSSPHRPNPVFHTLPRVRF